MFYIWFSMFLAVMLLSFECERFGSLSMAGLAFLCACFAAAISESSAIPCFVFASVFPLFAAIKYFVERLYKDIAKADKALLLAFAGDGVYLILFRGEAYYAISEHSRRHVNGSIVNVVSRDTDGCYHIV